MDDDIDRTCSPDGRKKMRAFSAGHDDDNDDDDDDDDGSLYPGEEKCGLGDSIESKGSSLWRQYSLINKSLQSQGKPDLCTCCSSSSFRHTLLKIIFIIVVGVGLLVSCLSLRYSTYGKDSLIFTGGDQILIPTSTYFNDKIEFFRKEKDSRQRQNVDDTVTLYLLPNIPETAAERAVYTDAVKFHIPSWSYQYWGLHLMAGTELKISICADLHLQFYILKSEKKLKDWKQTILFYKYDFQARIHPQRNCEDKKHFKSHLVKIKNSDVYYLLFSSSVGWSFFTEVSVVLNFNRTYYDVRNYKSKFTFSAGDINKTKGCSVDLRYGSTDIALLQGGSNLSHPKHTFCNFEFDYLPLPRTSFYTKLFGFVYLTVIIATLLYSIWRCCVHLFCQKTPSGEDRKPLLSETNRNSHYSIRSSGRQPWYTASINRKSISSSVANDVSDGSISDDNASENADEIGNLRRLPMMGSSMMSNQSVESLFSRDQFSRNDRMRRENQYLNDQQLLDSVMTSAGVSAI